MTEGRALRFAGSFFSAQADVLAREVESGLAAAQGLHAGSMPRAVISAHAGYRFSGRYTGMALGSVAQKPGRVVVLSPSHRHAFSGIVFPTWRGFSTPLGEVPIDRAACDALGDQGLAQALDAAHDNEHGIETQLPFIARLWPGVAVVPLVIGVASSEAVAGVIDALDRPDTLFVLSSDLSHFLDDEAARQKDAQTARHIERAQGQALTAAHACGARALSGWLASAAGQASKCLRLGMGNSADVTGDKSRVVGYGAWAFYPIDAPAMPERLRQTLLDLARRTLEIRLVHGREPKLEAAGFPAPLLGEGACFVTLTDQGRLRGCIGSLSAHQSLLADVVMNTQKAAFQDPRFAPVTATDLPHLKLKIAVLTRAVPMVFGSEQDLLGQIVPGQDGLIFVSGTNRGTFLPMVWEGIPEPVAFLRALKQKAGLKPDYWAQDVQVYRYRAESFAQG